MKGDWLLVEVSDGTHIGRGEASHSGNDALCLERIQALFERYVKGTKPSFESIRRMEQEEYSELSDFVTATAISGINQALYELVALEEGVPVWQLFTPGSARETVPVYVTINRALSDRSIDDYLAVVDGARRQGFTAIKCAPFEAVTMDGNQQVQSRYGCSVLQALADEFGDVSIRVDFHERFSPASFLQLLPELDSYGPYWYEEPCEIGSAYKDIIAHTATPIAAGEAYYTMREHEYLMATGWVNVVMPDVKHVGGLGCLIDICRSASRHLGVEVSLHNPSGAISTLASLHAAAVSPEVTSIEIPFSTQAAEVSYRDYLEGGYMRVPSEPGWGLTLDQTGS
ncbi:MAG: mandelate racemase/muconate lactonizing enzyme family protein [Fidelibacterota bacterium]|nr:MAG: mandelate racemase/muconate lactonizing enzyme family protein [Candidatus Neomarinimicrobiota bacterium]